MTSWRSPDYCLKIITAEPIGNGTYSVRIRRKNKRYLLSAMVMLPNIHDGGSLKDRHISLWLNRRGTIAIGDVIELIVEEECDPMNQLTESFDHKQWQGATFSCEVINAAFIGDGNISEQEST